MKSDGRSTESVRFWSKVQKTDGCWLWTGNKSSAGYGMFNPTFTTGIGAHREAWRLTNGEIPSGMFVCHKCDVRDCVRPDHLFSWHTKRQRG